MQDRVEWSHEQQNLSMWYWLNGRVQVAGTQTQCELAGDPRYTETQPWITLVLGGLLKSSLCSGQECNRKQQGTFMM